MIKTSVIILVIAIVIAGIAQIPRILNVRTVHYWNAEKKFEAARDRQLTPYEVDELMRGVGYRDFWRPVLDNVIIHGNEPAVREQLHDMVNGGYPETAFTPRALFALFRLGDNPDERMEDLLNILFSDNLDAAIAAQELLFERLDPVKDAKYAPELLALKDTDFGLKVIGVVDVFPNVPGVLDVILEGVSSPDVLVRALTAEALGQASTIEPGLKEDPVVIAALETLLFDGDWFVQWKACDSTEIFHGNEQLTSSLRQLFNSDRYIHTRTAALASLVKIVPPDQLYPILRNSLDDPSDSVRGVSIRIAGEQPLSTTKISFLFHGLIDRSSDVRSEALSALWEIPSLMAKIVIGVAFFFILVIAMEAVKVRIRTRRKQ